MLRTGCLPSVWRVGVLAIVCALLLPGVALAQQRGSISGKVTDPDGLSLPGVTVTVTDQGTGFKRTAVTTANGAFSVPNLDPGRYTVHVEMSGFGTITRKDEVLTAGSTLTLTLKMQMAGLQEQVTVEGEAPLVETTSNKIGGTLTGREIEDVPANFRNFTALTQLIPGMTPAAATSSFEGGQVTANGSPAQSNVYLLDGAYNNDDRLGGSQGTQVRVVLDNIGEYQVLSNQYSAEYGGGAGAIINMVSKSGTNEFSGRVYTYMRDDKFYARNAFLPADRAKPDERTVQAGFGLGGPIIKNRAHFYFTAERDSEKQAGFKTFPAAARPLANDFVGVFQVKALNTFGRIDVQLNSRNFLSFRALREKAPTKGEGLVANTQLDDAKAWEGDLDELAGLSYTTTISDRASNVFRAGWVREQLDSGKAGYFEETTSLGLGDGVAALGFGGREPFSIGQQNTHPSYIAGVGGTGSQTSIHTYTFDDSFSYFVPSLWGGEHTFKLGAGLSLNRSDPQLQQDSGTFTFTGANGDLPYNPANPATFPTQFSVQVGPLGANGFSVTALDRRIYAFAEDKWRATKKLTLNLGLRYDNQRITPGDRNNIAPRVGFAFDVKGDGKTVVRGGAGRFYLNLPISVELNRQRNGVITLFPSITITAATDTCQCILRPTMITDSKGNPGVAALSPAGIADLNQRRASVLAGSTFNSSPSIDSPDRKLANQWAFSFGVSRQLGRNAAVTLDYVGNVSRDQVGIVDINEPVNRVRPGVSAFDPTGVIVPAAARGTAYQRVLQWQSNPAFDGSYNSLQVAFVKRAANHWSGRVSYSLQKSTYTGLGNPDARRVWLDNDIEADNGRFASDKRHVLAATATVTPWKTLSLSALVSASSGAPINEIVGTDVNGDVDVTDRPIKGLNDLTIPIRSAVDSQGRAVINGLQGPNSFLVDMSVRYQIHLDAAGRRSLDLFYDVFNLLDRTNLVAPLGNRSSALFMVPTAAGFPRQMQAGVRLRF